MNRRDLIKLSAIVPTAALAQHAEHGGDAVAPAGDLPAAVRIATEARKIAAPDWKPVFLTPHENETVIVLSELIIPQTDTPGAKAALVNRYMDKITAREPVQNQQRLKQGLARLDDSVSKQYGKKFVELLPDQQVKVLEAMDADHDAFFALIKQRSAAIYYATKIGWDELNKGITVPSTFTFDCVEKKA